MGKVGFASGKGFSAMWSMDSSRQVVPKFDFIAYPSPGFFPTAYFTASHAWSITLSESAYKKPPAQGLTINIIGVEIDLAKNKIVPVGKPLELNYNHIDFEGMGIPNCIIFRPKNLKVEAGSKYLVEVSGLSGANGKPATIRYVVEFFDAQASPTFALRRV